MSVLPAMVHVVGAAVLRDGRVLASRRTDPPRLAGYWEFPGGKVEVDESDEQALVRELLEELEVSAVIGPRIGPQVPIEDTAVLRVYLVTITGEPQLVDHDLHRWLSVDELDEVAWVPVDAPVVEALRILMARPLSA